MNQRFYVRKSVMSCKYSNAFPFIETYGDQKIYSITVYRYGIFKNMIVMLDFDTIC